jgi:hypothetical protein
MPRIYRFVSKYPHPYDALNTATEQYLLCRKIDLYRSILTVGSPSFLTLERIRNYGLFRAMHDSIIEKVAMVAANIRSDQSGIRRHPIFDTYVSDKKRIVSYNLGMAFAKLYSQRLLSIPNLIHVESLKKLNAITFVAQTGKIRHREPDLVGQTADGKWHIFEAKGVSGASTQLRRKIVDAKIQVAQVASVQSASPVTRSACATYIGPDRILTHLEDPPSGTEKSINIDTRKFVQAYYSPFLVGESIGAQQRRTERVDGMQIEMQDIEGLGFRITIGVEVEILDSIRRGEARIQPMGLRRFDSDREQWSVVYSVGPDGFFVSVRRVG